MDSPLHWLGQLLDLVSRFPDIVALVVGSLIGYVFTAMMELYFLPLTEDAAQKRLQKGLTFVLCWLASGTASAILWVFLDPRDRPAMRISISYLVAVLSFAGYPFLAKVATGLFPKIGSAWAKPPQAPDGGQPP